MHPRIWVGQSSFYLVIYYVNGICMSAMGTPKVQLNEHFNPSKVAFERVSCDRKVFVPIYLI